MQEVRFVSFSRYNTRQEVQKAWHDSPVDSITFVFSAGYFDLDFAFELHPQGYGVRERGAYRAEGPAAVGDVLRIEIAGIGDVLYKKNGALVHTTINPTKVFPYYLVFKTQEVAGSASAPPSYRREQHHLLRRHRRPRLVLGCRM